MTQAESPINADEETLAETMLGILQDDERAMSEANAHQLIAAAIAYLCEHCGEDATIGVLADKAQLVRGLYATNRAAHRAGMH